MYPPRCWDSGLILTLLRLIGQRVLHFCVEIDCVGVSVALHGENKGLAGINAIWIPDPVSVCSVHERVSSAVAISDAADAPEALAAGYDLARSRVRNRRRGCNFVRS